MDDSYKEALRRRRGKNLHVGALMSGHLGIHEGRPDDSHPDPNEDHYDENPIGHLAPHDAKFPIDEQGTSGKDLEHEIPGDDANEGRENEAEMKDLHKHMLSGADPHELVARMKGRGGPRSLEEHAQMAAIMAKEKKAGKVNPGMSTHGARDDAGESHESVGGANIARAKLEGGSAKGKVRGTGQGKQA